MKSKKPITGKCKLCLEVKLLKKSHIYPKFMIRHLRDRKKNDKFVFLTNMEVKAPPQDGPKEHLLCEDCEKKFNLNETYYKEFMLDKKGYEEKDIDKDKFHILNYDYNKIRLFLLSLLWRLSVSSIEGWTIKMKSEDQEFLRLLLLLEDPGKFNEFPFQSFKVFFNAEHTSGVLMNPIESIEPFHDIVLIYICGIVYRFSKTKIHSKSFIKVSLTKKQWQVHKKSISNIPLLQNKIVKLLYRNGL